MTMHIRWLYLSFIILMLTCSCDGKKQEVPEKAEGDGAVGVPAVVDVIRLEGGDWGYPTPFAHYPRGPGGFKMALIFDSLLERDEKGLIPWLAEDYSISEDGMVYRFLIRQGVRWQDGTPLTPDDVAFSLSYGNRHAATWSYLHGTLETVSVEDNSVVVKLRRPQAEMLGSIGRTRIIPRHIWEKVERPKEFTTPEAVIGCGPFRLTHYSKEHGTYRFEAFADYWGPKPRVKSIEFVPVSEPILAYENHELDMIRLPPDVVQRFAADPANRIIRNPAFWGYRLLMNMSRVESLRDVLVRRALALAIDRNELVEKIARGAAIPGRLSILPPDHIMATDNPEELPHDPAGARTLLEEAGFSLTDGSTGRFGPDNTPLAMELLCSGREVRIAELLRQRLKEVGVDLAIRAVDPKTRDAKVRAKEYQLAIIGHGGWGGDAGYLAAHLIGDVFRQNDAPSASGIAGLDSPELSDLLKRQAVEIDNDNRQQLIEQIQRLAVELVPEIPLFYTAGHTMYRQTTYDGWMNMFDHHAMQHSKLSYLERTGAAARR